MNIKFTGKQDNGKNLGDSKEVIQVRTLVGFNELTKEFNELAVVRWYMSRSKNADRVYCTIWVTNRVFEHSTSGHAFSSGYGYCKQSDAFEKALNSAGIYSDTPISGCGMSVVDECLEALAKVAGYNHAYVAKG